MRTCIVTGGAGFIGCALSQGLADRYDQVIALDSLHPQIHAQPQRPEALDSRVALWVADSCDGGKWDELLASLEHVDTVVHLAAETGTAQSLLASTRHGMANVVGTTAMLDALARQGKLPRQIFLASSRAVYGEGAWTRADGSVFYPGQRGDDQLSRGEWDFEGAQYLPSQAGETQPSPVSVYGATKLAQEHLLCAWGKAMGVQVKILRLQNVYGPGQSLINAYTGILPLFIRMAKAGKAIPLYEDGNIIRDFVFIDDVAEAILLALDNPKAAGLVLDVGTGVKTTIGQVARALARACGAPAPQVSGQYRNGDVRHACCKMDHTRQVLGFAPKVDIEEGLVRLLAWMEEKTR